MKSKGTGKRLFLLALILAAVTAYLSYSFLSKQTRVSKETPEVETVKVWVAKENIAAREIVTEDMIIEAELPKALKTENYIQNIDEIVGKLTSESILKGEGFPKERIMESIENELSVRIHGSMRAVSIMVDKNSGVADYVRPGDRVDLFLYLPELAGEKEILRPTITKLMLQNIEVLAVRKHTTRESTADEVVDGVYDMTLAVPVLEIEKLFMVQRIGAIKLALRPLSGDTFYNSYGTIWEELLLDQNMKHRNFFPEYETVEDLAIVTEDKLGEYEALVEDYNDLMGTDEAYVDLDPSEYEIYTVNYGDTLIKISKDFYDDPFKYVDIKRANGLRTNKIYPGQQLKIPKLD